MPFDEPPPMEPRIEEFIWYCMTLDCTDTFATNPDGPLLMDADAVVWDMRPEVWDC